MCSKDGGGDDGVVVVTGMVAEIVTRDVIGEGMANPKLRVVAGLGGEEWR